MTDSNTIYLLLPEIILVAAATLIYVIGAFVQLRKASTWAAIGSLVLAAAVMYAQDKGLGLFSESATNSVTASGPLAVDLFGHTMRWGILAVGLMLVLITDQKTTEAQRSEEAGSILLMLAGLLLVAAGNELILLFLGLELVSIPTYVVLYVGKHDAQVKKPHQNTSF